MQIVTSVLNKELHYVFTGVSVYFRNVFLHVPNISHYFIEVFRTHQIRHFPCVQNVI